MLKGNFQIGTLYLVSTPIGNLEDVTLRALRILREVDIIACEDTRHTRKLLAHHHIHKPLTSYHSYNQKKKTPYILKLLQEGKSVALVTDSGTPGISDPHLYLVQACIREKIPFTAIPGATALITALVLSGFPTQPFTFGGFLPARKGKRRKLLESLRGESKTTIFYESPHRIEKTLAELDEIMPQRDIALARELTKKFEEVIRGKPSQVKEQLIEGEKIRGEMVVIISSIHYKSLRWIPPTLCPPAFL